MPKYNVYHSKEFESMISPSPAQWKCNRKSFIHVAEVEAQSLDHTFQLTNHGETSWPGNPHVTMKVPSRVRSTSVGDVITNITDKGESAFLVVGVGFQAI